jgi:hypothetical protein
MPDSGTVGVQTPKSCPPIRTPITALSVHKMQRLQFWQSARYRCFTAVSDGKSFVRSSVARVAQLVRAPP